ncbi:MAG: hypothetical protein LBT44_06105 [Clostridiales bacterium]|jgi:ribosome recycling factor|nr:hypothetical protein [Clostridiales bacterium]
MSLRPIDMTAAVQRSADTIKTGANEAHHRPEVLHQQFTEQLQKQVRQHEQQVQQSNKAESRNIKRDAKESGGKKRGASQYSQDKKEKSSSALLQGLGGSMLDIQI